MPILEKDQSALVEDETQEGELHAQIQAKLNEVVNVVFGEEFYGRQLLMRVLANKRLEKLLKLVIKKNEIPPSKETADLLQTYLHNRIVRDAAFLTGMTSIADIVCLLAIADLAPLVPLSPEQGMGLFSIIGLCALNGVLIARDETFTDKDTRSHANRFKVIMLEAVNYGNIDQKTLQQTLTSPERAYLRVLLYLWRRRSPERDEKAKK